MKKPYSLFLGGLMAVTTFTSQAQSVAHPSAPTELVASATSTASTAHPTPEPVTAPARQAAAVLAVAPEQRQAEQQATKQPEAPTKPTKVSKGVWIAIGVGVLLAVLRIVAAS
ncbi:hypothetical protein [Hymenobacter cellulosilyticus]|uniref:Uncharacterized protein n=1 Tax=Hymenobacter cellulosilyticus TaxID=2932248 RepID=A0A8T9Q742_9BACT|nr:hypothetical protein [Hymenobacter cellulosilyticus]UOQ72231.1 hypothetical protein MUN79_27360 [Hymenobacter cellulosilyticus]